MTLVAEERAAGHGTGTTGAARGDGPDGARGDRPGGARGDRPGGARPTPGEGLGSRLDRAVALLRQVSGDLHPELLSGDDAVSLYVSFTAAERLVVAGKSLLARRIEETSVWRDRGHATAAEFLAAVDGSGIGEARAALKRSRALGELPATREALRRGELSAAQANEITDAASAAPEAEADLVDSARNGASLTELRDDARRARNSATGVDPRERERRIHEGRYLRFRNEGDGSVRFDGRASADQGALLSKLVQAEADRLCALVAEDDRSTPGAHRLDALVNLVTGPSRPRASNGAAPPPAGPASPAGPSGPAGPTGPAPAPTTRPPTDVVLYCDLEALLRGDLLPGGRCELDTPQGPLPIPVAMARDLADDSFLRLVFHASGDIRGICHLGRTVPATLRTALVARDRCCVVPGCTSTWNLEIDHLVPFADGGPTTLDNLCLLCRAHHRMKTYDDHRLWFDAEGWHFEPPPAFEDNEAARNPRPPPEWHGTDRAVHITMSRHRRRAPRGEPPDDGGPPPAGPATTGSLFD
jgi:hypothetical protein